MGLVKTNDNCVGCNRCISACPSVGANVAIEKDRGNVIEVDPDKCIACGACIDACEHNAREYVDDVERFFADLKKGEKISVLIAPAFLANYPNDYGKYLGMLKKLGVNRFISVSFGADITTWGDLACPVPRTPAALPGSTPHSSLLPSWSEYMPPVLSNPARNIPLKPWTQAGCSTSPVLFGVIL